jgi:hypothetical protein
MFGAVLEDPSEFLAQSVWRESRDHADKLLTAWLQVIEKHEILRTRFLSTTKGAFQVVSRFERNNYLLRIANSSLDQALDDDRQLGFKEVGCDVQDINGCL